ncbi:MAG: prephenate dehydrogenase/arogenate dehydrogenase family protein [Sulfurimicrobium sp.]|nr:prephenate dehydrogenase/arogenate dehydrogenase family protein [Sulfurimicrobium sp.]MDP2198639.1 prephenate dehydrogenase/arogenate dehydrogenase family protein [Sulfurimicrobium sp.]
MINKLVIVGVGLIGGSLAMALRQAGAVKEIVGVGRSWENLETALQLGIIDRIETSLAGAARDADVIVLAVPVAAMQPAMQELAPHLSVGTIVTDAGSTKRDVIAYARKHLPNHITHFVPGHPIAGAEKSGAAAAFAGLFQGRNVVVTPLPENDAEAVSKISSMWQTCGAIVNSMPALQHDEIFAAVSHLPHLLSFALVEDIAFRANAKELFSYAAGGFRDFTRIAGSHPEMWRDICLANRDVLIREIDTYHSQLDRLRRMLEQNDGKALEEVFGHARTARAEWLEGKQDS